MWNGQFLHWNRATDAESGRSYTFTPPYTFMTYTGTTLDLLSLTFLAPELFFLILAHPVHKMWIIQEPNTLKLWNKLHFEEKKTESIHHV